MKRSFPMQESVTFQAAVKVSDGSGGFTTRWQDQFRAFAHITFKEGQEAVIGGGWQGQTPAVLTLRNSATARQIESTWRLKHRGRVFEIKEPPRLSPRRDHITMIIEGRD